MLGTPDNKVAFVDYDGNILLNSADLPGLNSCGGGIAISPDGKKLAVSDCEGTIKVYDLAWNGDEPVLTNPVSYNAPAVSTSWKHNTQLQFDPAGNLATFARGGGFRLYAVPNDNPETVTKAPVDKMIYGALVTGIFDLQTGEETPVYYNLQGMRVKHPQPGTIVIRRIGNKSEKILVR